MMNNDFYNVLSMHSFFTLATDYFSKNKTSGNLSQKYVRNNNNTATFNIIFAISVKLIAFFKEEIRKYVLENKPCVLYLW